MSGDMVYTLWTLFRSTRAAEARIFTAASAPLNPIQDWD